MIPGEEPVYIAKPSCYAVKDAALELAWDLLREHSRLEARKARYLAAVRLERAAYYLHQGRFTGPVAPDKADAFAILYLKVDSFKEHRASEAQHYFFKCYQRHNVLHISVESAPSPVIQSQ